MKTYTAAYLRVSSRKKTGKQKTDSQRLELSKYIKTHSVKPVKWFEDFKTGRTTKRNALQQIIADCRSGRCDQLIMYKLDRLSRNCRQTLELVEDLIAHGVQIVCVSQGLTFDDSPMGKFTLQIWAAVSELESNHISERTKAGLAVARSNGKRLGAAPDKAKRNNIARMKDKGLSLRAMAQATGTTRQSVHAMLKRIA